MKTAISVPDETFERVESRVQALGMSRSEFYSRAAARYLDELDAESVTGQIDAVVDGLGTDESATDAIRAGRRAVAEMSGDW